MAIRSSASLPSVAESSISLQPIHVKPTKVSGWGLIAIRGLGWDVGKTMWTSGGISSVYATHVSDGRPALLRYASTSTGKKDERISQDMQQECDALSFLKHPSIIRLEQYFETDFDIGMCLEWCDGGSVSERVQANGPVPETDAAQLLKQLFTGLAWMQEADVIHNALKPEALLLQSRCTVLKISDFSRATCQYLGDEEPRNPWLIDLHHKDDPYVAPELRDGKTSFWDSRADVWSAGLCSAYLLLGHILAPAVVGPAVDGLFDADDSCRISPMMRSLISRCLVSEASRRDWASGLVDDCPVLK